MKRIGKLEKNQYYLQNQWAQKKDEEGRKTFWERGRNEQRKKFEIEEHKRYRNKKQKHNG